MDSKTVRWAQVLFLVCLGLGLAKAQVHTVSAVPGLADYATFQEAIDAAGVGDTVYLYPGSYTGTVEKRLTLIGSGYRKVENQAIDVGLTITDDAIIRNLDILGSSDGTKVLGLRVHDLVIDATDNVTIQRCYVDGEVLIQDAFGVIILQCFFQQNGATLRDFYFRTATSFMLANCIVNTPGRNGVNFNVDANSNGAFLNCVFTGIEYGIRNSVIKNNFFSATPSNPSIQTGYVDNVISFNGSRSGFGANGIQLSPDPRREYAGFGDNSFSFDAYYQLTANSVLRGAGENGVDIGAFGGDFPYQLSGLPPIPIIYDLDMPDNTPAGQPLNVNVKVRTQN